MKPLLLVAYDVEPTQCAEYLALQQHGWAPVAVPELYHVPEESALWGELQIMAEALVYVTHLHARPAEWLLHNHGLGSAYRQVISLMDVASLEEFVEQVEMALRSFSPGSLLICNEELTLSGNSSQPGQALRAIGDDDLEWRRWYPIHDKSRCTECGHCLQFCLFGVYAHDKEGRVAVTHPDHCKAGCPACARICPHSAIMFPLYAKDAAIAGAPGQFVELDAEGRKLYYGRTGVACPLCGQSGELTRRKHTGDSCTECGRPLSNPTVVQSPVNSAATRDELDALLDELEELSGGKC